MVEPLAVGMHAAVKARIKPGDIAVVIGAGTIGMLTALAALVSSAISGPAADSAAAWAPAAGRSAAGPARER